MKYERMKYERMNTFQFNEEQDSLWCDVDDLIQKRIEQSGRFDWTKAGVFFTHDERVH